MITKQKNFLFHSNQLYNIFQHIFKVYMQNNQQQGQTVQVNNKEQIKQIKQDGMICEFWVARKRRQCKFRATAGSKYCSSHCSDLQGKLECPYEKGMFIDKAKFEKHLKNCPRIRDKNVQKQSLWYNESINKINQEAKEGIKTLIGDKSEQKQEQDEQKNLTVKIELSQLPRTLKQIPQNLKMIGKIIKLYLKCFKERQEFYIESNQKESLLETTNDHLQAKLITEKANAFGLISDKYIYVQFGAGKGILSFAIAHKVKQLTDKNSKNILLEREVRRNKFDRFFKQNPFFQRYRSDVSDFDFSLLHKNMAEYAKNKCQLQITPQVEQELQKSEMIGVCKHMCGEALDISVRGLLKANCKGNILASCCHHRCNYDTYLNPKFFKQEGWTPEETQTMFKMSSWGTMAHQFAKDDVNLEKMQELLKIYQLAQDKKEELFVPNPTEKIIIGRMCKRLIDFGRAQFLGGKVHKYCSDQLTPENYVIISG